MKLMWAHQTAPCKGEIENGDAVFTFAPEEGVAVVAVIDGLGHGPKAASVANSALETLARDALLGDAVKIIESLHRALRGSRGAAATVVTVQHGALVACGVGNVSLRSRGSQIPFVLSPGILGAQVRAFRRVEAQVRAGDRLLLHSDGISSRFSLEDTARLGVEEACAAIFETHRKHIDDSTVLILDVGD